MHVKMNGILYIHKVLGWKCHLSRQILSYNYLAGVIDNISINCEKVMSVALPFTSWIHIMIMICIHIGTKLGFELRGAKHEPKKFQVTWFVKKKKIMVDKATALYYLNI